MYYKKGGVVLLKELEKEELIEIIKKLQEENEKLKNKINNKIDSKKLSTNKPIKNITIEEKINIFSNVFNGRTDVYAKRWVSGKTGKSGYSPVCKNEFNIYKCDKPRTKCSDCLYKDLMPLTNEIIKKHLQGNITIGIYPLLLGDKCNFIVIDFDKSTYKSDVLAFWDICDSLNIPIYVERSRSRNGAHVWIFFKSSIYAKDARKMANILITKTIEKNSLDLDSYDRIFPNQDTIPKGGFGNLIALPFQGSCAKDGNTVFINKDFEPEKNQLNLLKNIKRLTELDVLEFIKKYQKEDYDEPKEVIFEKEESKDTIFIHNIECIFTNELYIKKENLTMQEIMYLKRLASFTNPKFYELQKLRMPIYAETTPRIIYCFDEDKDFLILPRGCVTKIDEICKKNNVKFIIEDKRELGINEYTYTFKGKLTSKQEKAKNQLLEYDIGVLSASTGFGKTVISAKIISELKRNTLIIVNRTTLLEQWKEKLSFFLDIDKKQIGQIGAGKVKANGRLDVASFQSLYKREDLEEIVSGYGLVIVDECHHVAAFSFEKVLKALRAKYVYGLTATPTRKDGWHKIIFMQCGDIRCRFNNTGIEGNDLLKHKVVVRRTNYKFNPSLATINDIKISDIFNNMAKDENRNNLIISDIKTCIKEGRTPIVLTERIVHLNILKDKLKELNIPIIIYKGKMGKRKLDEIKEVINKADANNMPRVILATSSSVGEGFDDSRLDTLFLTMPISWKGRVIQYVGRLNRSYLNKKEVIVYDYLDNMRILNKMFEKRSKGYKMIGYQIEDHI